MAISGGVVKTGVFVVIKRAEMVISAVIVVIMCSYSNIS